ncbi:VWA domain-containing protein [Candidatus Peregrinibacteria bacterium]|nr:VWA domain-containing protein [Candidatus Peregrinibacteria bacterium]
MKNTKIFSSLVLSLFVLSACQTTNIDPNGTQETQQFFGLQTDDWELKLSDDDLDKNMGFPGRVSTTSAPMMQMEALKSGGAGNIGYSVGGAKDINNFRENIENGYLPIPTDVTTEGLYYDYFFDTANQKECDKLFCPSYATAISKDPFSKEKEYYMTVGLNSNIKDSDFQRKKLNLVVVLDISGSMGSPFNQYYYDRFGNKQEPEESESKTKMEIAKKSLVGLLGQLKPQDRFGMVVFDDSAYTAKPLRKVGETNMQAIKDHVMELFDRGGTNMDAGIQAGTDLFVEQTDANKDDYENRIIFITDAMPNLGDDSEEGLVGMAKKNAKNGIYTTFIGVGVDFNTELVEAMTKIQGANYYSIHSEKDFMERMDEGFDYMVTPLVFDLKLELESNGFEIEKVYGSPEADKATGEIMYVNTLFPSKTEDGQTKGGVVLLKLKKTGEDNQIKLSASYKDRNGMADKSEESITFKDSEDESYFNNGVRKAILLARYSNILQDWLMDENRGGSKVMIPIDCPIIMERGKSIIIPEHPHLPPCMPQLTLGQWERQSDKLKVSNNYEEIFQDFATYFKEESKQIGDESLEKELEIIEKLAND